MRNPDDDPPPRALPLAERVNRSLAPAARGNRALTLAARRNHPPLPALAEKPGRFALNRYYGLVLLLAFYLVFRIIHAGKKSDPKWRFSAPGQ